MRFLELAILRLGHWIWCMEWWLWYYVFWWRMSRNNSVMLLSSLICLHRLFVWVQQMLLVMRFLVWCYRTDVDSITEISLDLMRCFIYYSWGFKLESFGARMFLRSVFGFDSDLRIMSLQRLIFVFWEVLLWNMPMTLTQLSRMCWMRFSLS